MYLKMNEYLRQLHEECSMVVQKMVKELPSLGLISAIPTTKEMPEDDTAVMTDFDQFMNSIMVGMEEMRAAKPAVMLQFILGQADVQAATGMLPDMPEDGDGTELAIWLGKAKIMGFKDAVLNSWSLS